MIRLIDKHIREKLAFFAKNKFTFKQDYHIKITTELQSLRQSVIAIYRHLLPKLPVRRSAR